MKFIVEHSDGLFGNVEISGAKNSALPVLAAALLCDKCEIKSVPGLIDVDNMCRLMEYIGCNIKRIGSDVYTDAKKLYNFDAPYELVSGFRGSFLVAAPLLVRFGRAKVCMPGGCAIGQRPVDLHLKGFSSLGAKISYGSGYVELSAKHLKGTKIYLDFPSVGATENIMMAACFAKGETILENAATEPEIVDLANFLNKAGAQVRGAGTSAIHITGKDKLFGCSHTLIPDRIEAGTFMTMAAITGGDVLINNVVPSHIKPVAAKLSEMGAKITEDGDRIRVYSDGKLKTTDIKTMPFPGFPTDMQAQFMSLLSVTKGTGIIVETIFENRYMHAGELCRMGANIKIEGSTAVIEGAKNLTGTVVRASDLRAGACLVTAGLCAKGQTVIENAQLIDRGYENFENKLNSINARITRCDS